MLRFIALYLTCSLILIHAKENDKEKEKEKIAICEIENSGANKSIALGAASFKAMIEQSEVFVDKTLFIKKILEDPEKLVLITYPRKWGKSVNLHMLKDYVEMQFDASGNILHPAKETLTPNYKLFRRSELTSNGTVIRLKSPLLISRSRIIFDRYHGKYPVLYLNCSQMRRDTFQQVRDELFDRVAELFQHFDPFVKILQDRGAINESTRFLEYKKGRTSQQNLTTSIAFLSKILHDLTNNSKAFVMFDDYDDPLNYAFMNENFTTEDRRRLTRLFADFVFSSFHNNEHLEKGILCGTLSIVKQLLNITDVKEYNFITNPLPLYFGITSKELDALLDNLQVTPNKRLAAHSWFGGYKGANGTEDYVYNPWAIAGFVKNKMWGNYWAKNSDIDLVFNQTIRHYCFRNLLNNLTHFANVSLSREYWQFSADHLLELLKDAKPYLLRKNSNLVDLSMSYLWATGHLVAYDESEMESGSSVLLHMPSFEVKDYFSTRILEYIGQELNRTLTFSGDRYRTTPLGVWRDGSE